jgi:hypothetical protein
MARTYLHHHASGRINIRTRHYFYGETLENYAADGGPLLPPLPNTITERLYEPGVRHALIRDDDVVDGGPMPWPEGDQIIASVVRLFDAQAARKKAEMEERMKALQEQAGT